MKKTIFIIILIINLILSYCSSTGEEIEPTNTKNEQTSKVENTDPNQEEEGSGFSLSGVKKFYNDNKETINKVIDYFKKKKTE
ncbi:MAG: hypothetical protein H7A23_21100 [Leptospiraceae bacterium]|nr:hypothetical protein [Leptospiraceae bacterium]MCP5497061.1 hypothetical protein [Leptospiraceae bacterium]